MRKVLFPVLSTAGVLLLMACGGGGGGNTGGSGNTGNTGGNSVCPDNLANAPNSEFCASIATTPNCTFVDGSYHTQVCGVPVRSPDTELARSTGVKEFGGSGPPDLGCLDPASYPMKTGNSQMVTMKGVVKIFSHGCETKNVTITIYEADKGDLVMPAVSPSVTTSASCQTDGVAVPDPKGDCGTKYECNFTYPNVPTEKELVVLTEGDFWAPLYDYNIYIGNDEVTGGVYQHDVRALATDDYSVIPQAAIGGNITPGNGALAGEVHDCGDVRLVGATVDVDVQKKILTYFTNDEDHPLPDLAATSTSTLGLYAALDVPPGKASVAALGLVNGQVTTVGYQRVQVFPNAVTAVTFRGVRAYQVSP